MGSRSKRQASRQRRPLKRRPATIFAAIIISGLVLGVIAGAGIWRFIVEPDAAEPSRANQGGGGSFPSYVFNSPTANARQGYQAAVDYSEELAQVPCFCGCGQHAGHKSVLNCFIQTRQGDNILFDRHGSGCKMCVDIALGVADGLGEGRTLKEIREQIEAEYGSQSDTPTPTPPIQG